MCFSVVSSLRIIEVRNLNKLFVTFFHYFLDKTSPNIIFTPGLPTKFREMPKITWTSTEYASFECSLDDNSVFKSCGEGVKGTWTQSKSRGGFHDFFVRGTDRNGNVGPTANFRFTIGM